MSSGGQNASVAAIFRWKEDQKETLQLLYVRRSMTKGDIWRGQIAFPGGRRQKPVAQDAKDGVKQMAWESLQETAIRETFEEIGLDLKAS